MQTENEELIYKNKARIVPGFSLIYPSSMIRYIERESIQRIYRIGLARSGCLGRLRGQGLRHKAVISGLDYGGGRGAIFQLVFLR